MREPWAPAIPGTVRLVQGPFLRAGAPPAGCFLGSRPPSRPVHLGSCRSSYWPWVSLPTGYSQLGRQTRPLCARPATSTPSGLGATPEKRACPFLR